MNFSLDRKKFNQCALWDELKWLWREKLAEIAARKGILSARFRPNEQIKYARHGYSRETGDIEK